MYINYKTRIFPKKLGKIGQKNGLKWIRYYSNSFERFLQADFEYEHKKLQKLVFNKIRLKKAYFERIRIKNVLKRELDIRNCFYLKQANQEL